MGTLSLALELRMSGLPVEQHAAIDVIYQGVRVGE